MSYGVVVFVIGFFAGFIGGVGWLVIWFLKNWKVR